jgi:hypothetical protein
MPTTRSRPWRLIIVSALTAPSTLRRLAATVGLCALVLGGSAPHLALADGGPTNSASSPAEQTRAAQKLQMIRLHNDPTYDYAQVTMSLWQEPQASYAALWCGEGSTTAVVGQWRGNAYVDNYPGGPDNYMAYLANTLGEFNGTVTTYDDYTRVTNSETNSTFYVHSGYVGGLSNYERMLSYDLQTAAHPLAPEVNANGLPGWGYNVAHFVTVKQYWITGDTTTYGDTAGLSQSRTMSANWNVVPLADFYNNHVAPLTTWSFDQIVW